LPKMDRPCENRLEAGSDGIHAFGWLQKESFRAAQRSG
jgi:hypothetical protein